MKFAQARELITPNIRTHMSGYASRTEMFKGIHDDFYVKVMYMENEGTKFLIVTYDLCHYTYDLNERVMDYAVEKFNMPYENIIINYSHTHAGPKITSPTEKETPSPLDGFIMDRTKSCIDRAALNLFEGSLSIASTTGRWNVNRRLRTKDGFVMRPNHNGITDDEVVIMTVRDADNKIKTVLVNYSCHPVTLSGTLYLSAEFPGRLCNLLESEYYGSMVFFLQGAAGNLRPLVTADKGSFKACSFSELDEFSKSIAGEVVNTIHSGSFRKLNPVFESIKFNIDIPVD
ncbi:MAG: neutral/alkaline non-lysosomal ceramidase N-terminal domain-containing protein, partial [Clostridia bacterium]|nr:neutral/alkaline non-lysosomal ceramidase N-terminal domain-containing protein [Clostridia bacterium]